MKITILIDGTHSLNYPYQDCQGYDVFCWVNEHCGDQGWQEYTLLQGPNILQRVINPNFLAPVVLQ